MDFNIPEALKVLPNLPGVYIMKDENGAIIYVGKAVNLKSRVRSYFQESGQNYKVRHMAPKIKSFEYLVTDTENEAFILENNLIKLHRPKYNIRLKDDKAYPYVKVTREKFPRLLFAHQRGKDKARYYGPFVSRMHVRELIELAHRIWRLRRCSKIFPRDYGKSRPCLNHHIGRCSAPCNRLIDEDLYNQYLHEAEQFITGKKRDVQDKLAEEMAKCAEAMEYERAAELRDTINALNTLTERQKVETGDEDRDIVAIARGDSEALVQIYFVRGGKLSGREHYMMSAEEAESDFDIITAFVKQFYSEAAFIPKELVLQKTLSEQNEIASWLSGLTGRQVTITVPKKGDKKKMVELAASNAELTMSQFGSQIKKEAERNAGALSEIAEALQLESLARIEAYDISNIQGYESVGSMVVFENGKAKNSDYRKFRLRAVIGANDYAGMEEVLSRRLKRAKENHDAFSKLPDVIFVDGGKGQVSAAEKALEAIGYQIPVCGMVKDDNHRTRGLIFRGEEIKLPRSGEGFKLITRVQDEVHRFALEYHRKLRANTQIKSVLDDIPGIGKLRRKALIKHFKSMEAIKEASADELANSPAMNKKAAEAVYNFFNNNENNEGKTIKEANEHG